MLVLIDESLPKPIRREHIRPLMPLAGAALHEMAPGEIRTISPP